MPLAGHGHVVGAAQAQPDGASGEGGAEGGDGREAVRLHLLAAEAAAHPQALDGHRVGGHAQHVGDDLLGLGGVLGAALHEHLAALVDQCQRGVGLEVEVLLPRHLGDAAEDVGRGGQAVLDVPPRDDGLSALEALRLDRLGQRHHGRQRLVVHLHRGCAEPGGLQGLPQHPAHGVADEHHDLGEERLVVLDAGVVEAWHVGGGEHTHDAVDGERRGDVEPGDPGVGVGRADRVRVQHPRGALHQVVGVERVAGDVEVGALVGQGLADAHRATSRSGDSAHQARSALPSIAER